MPDAPERKLFYGLPWGQVIVVMGPPKTGKSTLAGSMADVVPAERIALLVTKANEANSWRYRQAGLSERAEIFSDSEWDPDFGKVKAGAWRRLNERINKLTGDASMDGIIIDSGTDAVDLLAHEILAGMQVGGKVPTDPGDLKKPGAGDANFVYYGKLKVGAQRFMNRLVECAMHPTAPKFIIIPWHTQSASEDDLAREGVTFEGKTLPMIEGRYREKLAGDCDVVVYTDIKRVIEDVTEGGKMIKRSVSKHVIQVRPSVDKHAAVRAMPMGTGGQDWLENSFKALHEAIVNVGTKGRQGC